MNASNLAPAKEFIDFVNQSPTPFHVVHNCVTRLEAKGFTRLHERDSWANGKLQRGGKYFVTRNQSTIIAFTVPPADKEKEKEEKPLGMSIVGCHTDSPRFIIKPVSKREKGGFAEVGVETYGGGIWATWLDRDLGIAGRVVVSGAKGASSSTYTSHLIHNPDPILRMPTLAIHLDRTVNDKLAYNAESQMVPILALASKELNKAFVDENNSSAEVSFADPLDITSHHHPILLHTIAKSLTEELGEEVTPSQIHDFELSLYDTQSSTIGGALSEFIFSPRIDNLFSSFAALQGLILASESPAPSDGRVSMIALFDHEEVGSVSAFGAESNFIESCIERVAVALKVEGESEAEAYQRTLASSFLLSSDVGHSCHPSFMDKHEDNHRSVPAAASAARPCLISTSGSPLINSGIAIKSNAKQRYATTSQTVFPLRRVAAEAGVPLQEYVVRNDMACGSTSVSFFSLWLSGRALSPITVGPLVSKIGLRTVDIGAPTLSMHSYASPSYLHRILHSLTFRTFSIREMAGTRDIAYLIDLFEKFFERFGHVDTLASTMD
ncbi:SPOSA6832_00476 [Sporobolomyces salmonicolor]|uniref:aspartyl aminopeptidase n=1 Tax=Sporidiobolus salmonicolor TaxID=5005 RepID=A0A0D6EGS2_SPOSA|nr:SPOSA6832_00476 [Sporobolomyces salmonicolor]